MICSYEHELRPILGCEEVAVERCIDVTSSFVTVTVLCAE